MQSISDSFLLPANEVWGKVIFLHLSVILFTGGVPGQVPHGTGTPPWQVHPLGRYPHPSPLGRYTPPWADTPPGRYTPLGRYTPSPGAVHAGRYGQQAGGMHPTGIHSCSRWGITPDVTDENKMRTEQQPSDDNDRPTQNKCCSFLQEHKLYFMFKMTTDRQTDWAETDFRAHSG